MRSLPVGRLRTRKIRTTANATAARPPATPNQATLGSTYPPSIYRRVSTVRSDRLKLSPREVEGAERPRRARPISIDPVDAGGARPFLHRLFEVLERVAGSFGDNLHRPVVVVSHPATQAELVRPALHEVAKAHALDVTTY